MSTEGERISSIISRFCESKADFARRIGEKPQTVSNWVARGAGKNVLNKILAGFPEVNANWLLTGDGDMINPIGESLDGNTNKPNDTNSRIRQIINEYFNDSIAEFCSKLNLLQPVVRTTLERDVPPSNAIVMAIINDESLNINVEWLMTGEGNKLKQTADSHLTQSDASYVRTQGNDVYLETPSGIKYFKLSDDKYRMRVPLVPFNAYARYANEACSEIVQDRESWDEVEFVVDKIGHGSYMGFEIKGDSMDDDSRRSFAQGDIVLARELDKIHWKDGLRYEKFPFWIIVLEGTILCKQIIEHNVETGDITCHSLNPSPEYSDFTINLSRVCRIFNIIQKTLSAS